MKNKNILYILVAILCTILILVFPGKVTEYMMTPESIFVYLWTIIQTIAVTVLLLYVIKNLKE